LTRLVTCANYIHFDSDHSSRHPPLEYEDLLSVMLTRSIEIVLGTGVSNEKVTSRLLVVLLDTVKPKLSNLSSFSNAPGAIRFLDPSTFEVNVNFCA
jgi:hypothetical protein